MPWPPPFSESDLRAAIAQSLSWAATLRALGYESKGANYRTLQRWAKEWEISTDHFDPDAAAASRRRDAREPLEEVMVEDSTYARGTAEAAAFRRGPQAAGVRAVRPGRDLERTADVARAGPHQRRVQRPPVGESADRVRELRRDARHALRPQPASRADLSRLRSGVRADDTCATGTARQDCWGTVYSERKLGVPQPHLRKVERPSYEQLKEDVRTMSMLAVGRKYGVSDNAVRKWIRWYERGSEGKGETEAA